MRLAGLRSTSFAGGFGIVALLALTGCSSSGASSGSGGAAGESGGGAQSTAGTGGATAGGSGGAATGGSAGQTEGGSGGEATGGSSGAGGSTGTGGSAGQTAGGAGGQATGGSGGATTGGTGGSGGSATGGSAGQSTGGSGGAMGMQHSGPGTSWTVLAYWIGDNNIDSAVPYNIAQMAQVGSNDKLTILLEAKRDPSYDGGTPVDMLNIKPYTGTKRFRVEKGSLTELATLPDTDVDKSASIADFVQWGIGMAPADHYAVFLWDHGGGWGGLGEDNLANMDFATLPRLRAGLQMGLQQANVQRLAVLGYDACFMGSFEDVASVRGLTEYYLGSEAEVVWHAWDYTKLQMLADNPGTLPVDFGKAMVDGYYQLGVAAGNDPTETPDQDDTTLSLVDMYQTDALVSAMKDFSTALGSEDPTVIGKARKASLGYNVGGAYDEFDLASFATQMATLDPNVSSQATAVTKAISTAVVYDKIGAHFQGSSGVSIGIPSKYSWFDGEQPIFDAIGAAVPEAKPWTDFLDANFTAAANESKPAFTDANYTAMTSTDANGNLVVSGTLSVGTAPGVVDVKLYVGTVASSGDISFFIDRAGSVDLSSDLASATFNGNVLTVKQGTSSAQAYRSSVTQPDGSIIVTIPIVYYETSSSQGQDAAIIQTYDSSLKETGRAYSLPAANGGAAQVATLPAGSSFQVELQVQAGGTGPFTWTTDPTYFDPSMPVTLAYSQLASGTNVAVEIDAYNANGDDDYETAQFSW